MIGSTVNRMQYAGAGLTGPYAFAFCVFAATDLQVTKRSSAGAETTLAYLTDFVLAAGTVVGDAAGGSITLTVALAVGEVLTIRRVVPLLQPVSLANQSAYFGSTHETEFDRLVAQVQQLDDRLRRSVGVGETYDPAGLSLLVPAGETGKVLGWDSSTILTNKTLDSSAVALPGSSRTVATLSAYLANNAVFNVKDYGAVGNGVANDYPKIAAAIAACSAAGGGVVFFPPGVYPVLTQILGASRVSLVGVPGASTILNGAPSTVVTPLRYIGVAGTPVTDFVIRDLIIDGGHPTFTAYNPSFDAIWLTYTERFAVENVVMQNAENDALVLESCRWGRVTNCIVKLCCKDAIYLSGSDHILISGNQTQDVLQGIAVAASWYCTIVGNNCRTHVSSPYPGLGAGRDSRYCVFTGNYADGFHVEPEGIGAALPYGSDHPDAPPIYDGGVTLYGIQGCTITGNVFANNVLKTTPPVGIRLNKVLDSVIADNVVAEILSYGMFIVDSKRNTIRGNKILNCGNAGTGLIAAISLGGTGGAGSSDDNTFDGNVIDDTRAGAAAIMGGMACNSFHTGTRIIRQRFGSWLGAGSQYGSPVPFAEFVAPSMVAEFDTSTGAPVMTAADTYLINFTGLNTTGFDANLLAPRRIRLIFTAVHTLVAGANMKLAGGVNFVGTADDVLEMATTDGLKWYEVSRSVN